MALIIIVYTAIPALSQGTEPVATAISWQRLETDHAIILYQSPADLLQLHNKVNFGKKLWGLRRLFTVAETGDTAASVKQQTDALFERVQEILDMRKPMPKVTINLYHDKRQLQAAYTALYGTACKIRAWYRYDNDTVYLTIADLHEGMLAHELAHAIIDHYLLVRPPAASAEILARYVDSHLR